MCQRKKAFEKKRTTFVQIKLRFFIELKRVLIEKSAHKMVDVLEVESILVYLLVI